MKVRVFLDENMPRQLSGVLDLCGCGNEVSSVFMQRWEGMKDEELIPEVASAGFNVFVTRDLAQAKRPGELDAIIAAGFLVVMLREPKKKGLTLRQMAVWLLRRWPEVEQHRRRIEGATILVLNRNGLSPYRSANTRLRERRRRRESH